MNLFEGKIPSLHILSGHEQNYRSQLKSALRLSYQNATDKDAANGNPAKSNPGETPIKGGQVTKSWCVQMTCKLEFAWPHREWLINADSVERGQLGSFKCWRPIEDSDLKRELHATSSLLGMGLRLYNTIRDKFVHMKITEIWCPFNHQTPEYGLLNFPLWFLASYLIAICTQWYEM